MDDDHDLGPEALRAIYRATSECVKIVAFDGTLLQLNAAGLRTLEVPPDTSPKGRCVFEFIAPEDRQCWIENHHRVCSGEARQWQFDLISLLGNRRRMESHAVPLRLADGCTAQLAIFRDITKQRESEIDSAHLAAIIASSNDAIVSKNLNGIVTSWNGAATRIFGYEAPEMIGQSITRLIPKALLDEEAEILSRLRRGECVEHFDTVRVTKDGRQIDVSLTISPVRDRSGSLIGASKIVRDVTERKQAERLQKLLMDELNHRVKNTLATVQSIASRTVRTAGSPSEFAASFMGRLQALSKAHILLTGNSWRGAQLSDVIRDQVIARNDQERVNVEGPRVVLDPQTALLLGLVFHELATNSRKYGSLSRPTGRLQINWSLRREPDERVAVEWLERGGPPVCPPTRQGFGTTLIERSILGQAGTLEADYATTGLCCRFSWPLKVAQSVPPLHEVPEDLTAVVSSKPSLSGTRVLIIEDEPLVALDLADVLADAGCSPLPPASNVADALAAVSRLGIDVALLDANLAGQSVEAVAAALCQARIPFAFVTGYSRQGLPDAFRLQPIVPKPFDPPLLLETMSQLLATPAELVSCDSSADVCLAPSPHG